MSGGEESEPPKQTTTHGRHVKVSELCVSILGTVVVVIVETFFVC